MHSIKAQPRHVGLLLAVLMTTTALAGCAGDDSGADSVQAYEEAKSAPGTEYKPVAQQGATGDVHLKLMDPADPSQSREGKQPIVVLLYDKAADEPIPDAELSLESRMEAHDHDSVEETDPAPQGSGVYKGRTNHVMPGEWTVTIDAATPGGAEYSFEIQYTVVQ